MSKKRIKELDILRAAAFLFVVLQHTVGGFSYRDGLSFENLMISKFIYTIAKAGVPLFLFLSAATLIYTYGDKLDVREFYVKKIKFLFLPFAVWSVYCVVSKGQALDSNIIWTIVSGDAQYHLWYMAMIIRFYLYFPLIYLFNKYLKRQKNYVQLMIFICLTAAYFILDNFDISGFLANLLFNDPTDMQQRFFNCSPLYYYIYFVFGQYFINHYERFKELIINNRNKIIISYTILLLYEHYVSLEGHVKYPFSFIKSYSTISVLFFCMTIIIMYIAADYLSRNHKYITYAFGFIGKYSFPAYLIHISVVNELTFKIPTTNQVTCMIKFWALTVIISIGICWVLSYLPFAKYILGVHSHINFEKIKDAVSGSLRYSQMNNHNTNH